MKFTLSWLKDFLDTTASLDQISETLTAIGLEVEEVIDASAALAPFVVALIEEAVQHPGADKLRVCKVNDGSGIRQVVCGASNARAGIKVVLAREGVKIPANGMIIKKSSIRNVESNGMLCSGAELGITTDSAGIIELPADAKPGESIVGVLGLDDPVIDIAVTPNRADALGVHGIARDLAAAGLGKLKTPHAAKHAGTSPSPITVTTETPGCPLFIGCHIRGVRNGPSPDWLQQRLKAVGLRPISALVDITNYMTIAYDRPLHVFDAKKLKGNITVRDAKDGEKLQALDGKEYTLKAGMVAVCDDESVVGLGGIIGGNPTGCEQTTTDIFLEAAFFDPLRIATTGRALMIESDARYRFERGVDPAFVKTGAEIAIGLIQELCGGTPGALVIAGAEPDWRRGIAFDLHKVHALGGVRLPEQRITEILSALGCEIKAGVVMPPSWRADIEGQADLVEEVLRIARYDAIPSTPLPAAAKTPLSAQAQRTSRIRRMLAARGLTETCGWAFVPHAHAVRFGGGAEPLKLLNPINAELDTMRPNLLPNLLMATARNADRGSADLALFETGNVFENVTPQGQKLMATGIRAGQAVPRNPHEGKREADLFDAKADLFALLEVSGLNPAKLAVDRNAPGWYHPTRAGRISLGGKVTLGFFGELHPLILSSFGIKHRVTAFEAALDAIPLPKAKSSARPPLSVSNFQAVERDFAFVGDERVAAADIAKAVEGVEKQLIRSVDVFDVFHMKNTQGELAEIKKRLDTHGSGGKSVAISVTLQAMDRTLTDAEIEAVAQKIIAAASTLGLTLRA